MNEEQYNELSDLADKFFSQFDNPEQLKLYLKPEPRGSYGYSIKNTDETK